MRDLKKFDGRYKTRQYGRRQCCWQRPRPCRRCCGVQWEAVRVSYWPPCCGFDVV